MELFNKNGINILIEAAPKTPRYSIQFFFKIFKKQKYNGINSLLARLLLQGTKKYSASRLAYMFENECIDISTKAKQDYIKVSLCFLNEDFELAMDLVKDLILNSTFDDFEKEVIKIKGDINSDLDNPKVKMTDAFVKTIYKNHPYSETSTTILNDLDKITKEDIIEAHKQMLASKKAIVIVGDIENQEKILSYFENKFSFMKSNDSQDEIEDLFNNSIEKDEYVWISKNDAKQAQIIQGCLLESFNSELCAKISVMNNILGSSGLSSRMFVNLRDKQGLAYNVRSQYDTMLHSAIFNMYIGTTPKNIRKSLEGFRIELEKLANEKVTDEELKGAKENISGKLKYFSQNNSQIASVQGYNFVMGLGLKYKELYLDDVYNVSKDDVCHIANKIINTKKTTAIIAPDEYKEQIKDLL